MSSEFHAWGDSNLYLRRLDNELTLTVEHRAAPSLPPLAPELAQRGEALALELRVASTPPPAAPSSLDERIRHALETAARPMPLAELREICRVRNATLHERLTAMTRAGHVLRDGLGYRLSLSNSLSTTSTA